MASGKKGDGPINLQPAADMKLSPQNQKLLLVGLIVAFRGGWAHQFRILPSLVEIGIIYGK